MILFFRRARTLMILTSIISFIVGCKPSENNAETASPAHAGDARVIEDLFALYGSRWNDIGEFKCETQSHGGDPFACLQLSCAAAEGRYDEPSKTCTCPKGLGFAATYGKCLPLIPARLHAKQPATQILLQLEPPSDPRANLSVDLNKIWEDEFTRTQMLNFPVYTHYGFSFKFATRQNLTADDLLQNLRADPNLDNRLFYQSEEVPLQQSELAYSDPRGEILARLRLRDITRNQLDGFDSLRGNPALVDLAEDLKTWLSQDHSHFDQVRAQSDNGCLGICTTDTILQNVKFRQAHYLIDHLVFLDGTVYSHLLLWSATASGSSPVAVVKIDNSGMPNLVYLINYSNQQGQVKVTADILDREGTALFKNETIFSRTFNPNPLPHLVDAGTVAVCENGFAPFALAPRLKDRLVSGPYRAGLNDFSGSLWGWIKNPSLLLNDYLAGAQLFGRVGYVNPQTNLTLTQHNGDVAMTVLQNSDTASVTNLSLEQCLSPDPEINPLLHDDYPGVAVNLSAGDLSAADDCATTLSVIQKTAQRRLWLVAAGNDQPISECDRKVRELDNVVSVGAMDENQENQLASYARGVEKNVQVAPDLPDPDHIGTSFTAPSVSGLVGDLSLQFHLTPAQLKRSLLVGTDFLALDIASGGRLNPNLVRVAATTLNAGGDSSTETLLQKIYDLADLQAAIDPLTVRLRDPDLSVRERAKLAKTEREAKRNYMAQYATYQRHLNWLKGKGI